MTPLPRALPVVTPRSFLLTVHEPGSAVLEDLATGRRVHVSELADLGAQVMGWLAENQDAAVSGARSAPEPG